MNTARAEHTETLLSNGRVLVAGGIKGTAVLNSAATYNPHPAGLGASARGGIMPP